MLGAGSMGVVMSAEHLELGISVAIKALHPESRSNREALARFRREARAAAHIRGEHVARVLDVGSLDDGTPFMVMECLEGEDLGERLERGGPLPVHEAVDWVLQACEAVGEAHALGIIHRDLKPQNLFCARGPDGTVSIKVLDFGISKMPSMRLTETHACVGSPCYMSPEQLQSSRDVDARSDVWSLGAVLYELLTGRLPFDGETMPELCTRILTATPTPMQELRPEIPVEMDAVVRRALAKDRAERLANVADLASALAPFGPAGAAARTETIARLLGAQPLAAVEDCEPVAKVSRVGEATLGARSGCPLTMVTAMGPASRCEPLPVRRDPAAPTSSRVVHKLARWAAIAGIGAAAAIVLLRTGATSGRAVASVAAAQPLWAAAAAPAHVASRPAAPPPAAPLLAAPSPAAACEAPAVDPAPPAKAAPGVESRAPASAGSTGDPGPAPSTDRAPPAASRTQATPAPGSPAAAAPPPQVAPALPAPPLPAPPLPAPPAKSRTLYDARK
jgi:serine/threonine-protein kinase